METFKPVFHHPLGCVRLHLANWGSNILLYIVFLYMFEITLLVCHLHGDFSFVCQVCLRNNPLYHAGAVAFSISAGIPKVGVLMESVWNMNDSCRFQLRSPESLKSMDKASKTTEAK